MFLRNEAEIRRALGSNTLAGAALFRRAWFSSASCVLCHAFLERNVEVIAEASRASTLTTLLECAVIPFTSSWPVFWWQLRRIPIAAFWLASAPAAFLGLARESRTHVCRRLGAGEVSQHLSKYKSRFRLSISGRGQLFCIRFYITEGLVACCFATLLRFTGIAMADLGPYGVILPHAACRALNPSAGAKATFSACAGMLLASFGPSCQLEGHRESWTMVRVAGTNTAFFSSTLVSIARLRHSSFSHRR